ncbi:MAG TPA: substrate-binding domain-containing protein [Acidobacteriaceae bacterium]|nr:substrate-binding domain-containing protein [Acidobacteriaceae bacterium]
MLLRLTKIFVAALLTFNVSANAQITPPLTGSLRIVGTDTMKDLLTRWIDAFTARHPGVHIELTANGALTAAPVLASGAADLVPLGRELTPSELKLFRASHSYLPTAIPVALGSYDISGKTVALAFYVNSANPVSHLTFQQLDAIYCTSLKRGEPHPITTWRQVGVTGNFADKQIHPIGVNFPDGISNFIRLRVCSDGDFRMGIREEHTGGAINVLDRIVSDIAQDPTAIGYAGFANLKPGTKLIPISEDGGPYLSGSRAEVSSTHYPLTRTIYLYVDRSPDHPLSPIADAFIHFVISPAGQALVATDGVYMPLPLNEGPVQREVLKSPADSALPHYKKSAHLTAHLVSFGTDTMDDLMKLWIAGFNAQQPNVAIDLQSKASMSVPAALTAGTAQLSPLSREFNPAEIEAFRAKHGYAPTEVAVALGSYRTPTRTVALTFYVNDANPIQRLTLPQLDAIWCTTLHRGAPATITTWGQLGLAGEWRYRPIHLVGVQPPDGVPNFISRRVCSNGSLRDGIFGEKNGEPRSVLTRIVEDVARDPLAIGYAGFHNRQPNTRPVQLAETAAGPFLSGTFDEVRTARFPLTRFVYVYVDRNPAEPLNPAVKQFLTYVLSLEGQRKVEEEGIFMPLPSSTAAAQRAKLN